MSRRALPNFDRIARAYRWLEYLALGPLLARTRRQHLSRLGECRHALVLGDGDGRFTAELLARYPGMQVEAVDTSATMLHLLARRAGQHAGVPPRLTTWQADARAFLPTTPPDLVVTHFFLDCLTSSEVAQLIAHLGPHLAPHALWLVSEFRIPRGAFKRAAELYIRALYFAFRIITGLRVRHLPDWDRAFARAAYERLAVKHRAFGLLTAELWRAPAQDSLN